jgi:hypothetical protein
MPLAAFLACASCTDIGTFTTDPGECYRGEVVEAEFVRTGFADHVQLSLTLNTDALAEGAGSAGTLSTSDQIFLSSAISQMEELAHDTLSQFQFPGGRIRNYLVYVMATDGAPAMMVISLMEDEHVEVRIMRPEMDPCMGLDEDCDIEPIEPLFGVFRLSLDTSCSAADAA